jgi:transcriptional regulator with XRE-family HTH domain
MYYGREPMRSTLATVVSVVRHTTGLSSEEFGELIGKPQNTIKKLEAGILKLSEGTALSISRATGVGLSWLLAGDPKTPPTDDQGRPWDRESFEHHQAYQIKKRIRKGKNVGSTMRAMAVEASNALLNVLDFAMDDEDKFTIMLAKSRSFIDGLAQDL